MSATVHGSVNFGLVAETGLYASSVDFDMTQQEKWIGNGEGEDVAGALYNGSATFSMSGVKKVGETLSAVLGSSIVLANAIDFSDYFSGYVSGGLTYLKDVKSSLKSDDFETLDLTGGFKPFVVTS
ncbi:MAG: hypothetical protein ACSHX0_06885 [Akkermansiaceae bacterium]